MPSPPITLYMTTIASQPALRQRQEYLFRILQVKKIPFNTYDLASDEEAKRLWRRKAPLDKQQLPGILVGGKFPGTFAEFEDAVEHGELDIFLRLKEEWNPADEDRPPPDVKPVGIPGASSPLQMTPERLRSKIYPSSPAPSPLGGKPIPVNKRVGELDMGDELSGFGLQGVKVTEDELSNLIAELGLGGNDAKDLASGLSDIKTTPVKGLNMSKKKPKDITREENTVKKEEAQVEAVRLQVDEAEVVVPAVEEKVDDGKVDTDVVVPTAEEKAEDGKANGEEAENKQADETSKAVETPKTEPVTSKE